MSDQNEQQPAEFEPATQMQEQPFQEAPQTQPLPVDNYISSYREPERIDPKSLNLKEEVIQLNRTAKVVKGGRRFSFAALVVVGDGNGHIGVGFGKANEVPEAISKAAEDGKKNLIKVPMRGRTIPHAIIGEFGAARVMLKPASEGTGLIAGAGVRTVLSLAGIHDILTKVIGTNNKINVVKATIQGLGALTSAQKIAELRGRTVPELFGHEPSTPGDNNENAPVAFAAEGIQE